MEYWRGERRPTIKSVMTPFPHTVGVDDSVCDAQEIMRKHGVHHVPVEENGNLVGVATHVDIARQVNSTLDEKSRQKIRVRDVYAPDPYVVDLDESLEYVLLQLVDRQVDSALVVRKGKLVGIFTAVDACRVLADVVRSRFAPSGGHDAA